MNTYFPKCIVAVTQEAVGKNRWDRNAGENYVSFFGLL